MLRILAVAIGEPSKSRTITDIAQLTGVRPYIVGLIIYLSQQTIPGSNPPRKYTLGVDFTIYYRECYEDDETFSADTDVIFCMSTPVTRKARIFTRDIPIVGIFSEHILEQFDQTPNICGLNAQRIQIARQYYDNFLKTVPGLTSVYVLHRVGNTASTKSLAAIRNGGALPKPLVELKVTPGHGHDIATLIKGVPLGAGLLPLPVDLFFGEADKINAQAAAKSLPVFWPVTDWVAPGVGGFGLSQARCGELMGRQVQFIFEHLLQIPQGPDRFMTVQAAALEWVASQAAANALNITLGKHDGLRTV